MFKSFIPYILILSIINLLLSNAIASKQDMSILISRNQILIFFYSAYLCYNSAYEISLEKGISILSGLFTITSISHLFSIFILALGCIISVLTSYYARKVLFNNENLTNLNLTINHYNQYNKQGIYKVINKDLYSYKVIEYSLIMAFVISGAIFLINTNDLVSIFLSIELQSYGLYLMCCLWRDSEKAISAGLTYFLLGALSSCLILLGTVILYVYTGTSNLDVIISISNLLVLSDHYVYYLYFKESIFYINLAICLIMVGFLFKISAAPFHFWSPDVYDKIPTIVTTFVAIVSKISILVVLLWLVTMYNNLNKTNFPYLIVISSLLSLIIGTVLGLKETKIKRLLAYSTISHLGFILLAISINTLQSIQAFVFYLIQYSISNLNVFFFVIMIGYSLYSHHYSKKDSYYISDRNNSPIQYLNELKGYFTINPVISLGLMITIFSFVGVPPLIGFFAKQMVLASAINNGYIFLSIIAILTSVIGAVYYLLIIKYMFFDKPVFSLPVSIKQLVNRYLEKVNSLNSDEKKDITKSKLSNIQLLSKPDKLNNLDNYQHVCLSSSLTFVTSFLTLIILTFMLTPEESLNLSNIVALTIFLN